MITKAAADVLKERQRQLDVERWSPEDDDEYTHDELALAASCYAHPNPPRHKGSEEPLYWPWDASCWKPKSRRHNLVRAAALLLAEIERLDRS